ncbi:GntR family transcriptional regulator [Amycolatopsis sp. YIM 10]|uniref:GntR family transcriptional regulator n=1 Tax=Amycolatopsis sp. YIM 10 TaxID=2653857 RepID=UPI00128FF050|nr:GntR family transcriptional regulator [Amycolatopsis sp. YIM 10]QFU94498.1 HTH-type transcriptional repressor YvoA [Amycolatopsis sp. YIM 10]
MIDRASGLPAYRQVADELRKKINAGEYHPGDKLPSERVLVDTYQVSRITIREAVGLLRAEGLVSAEHGKGVFIRPPHKVERLSRSRLSRAARSANKAAFFGDAAAHQFTPAVEVEIRTEEASAEIAAIFDIGEGDEVLVREQVMSADGQPIQLATSRLPRSITAGTAIEQTDTGPGGSYARLEEAGHVLGHFSETVGARMPTPEETSLLQLSAGTPIIVVRRVAFDREGVAVEVNDMRLSGDRYELAYEFPAD